MNSKRTKLNLATLTYSLIKWGVMSGYRGAYYGESYGDSRYEDDQEMYKEYLDFSNQMKKDAILIDNNDSTAKIKSIIDNSFELATVAIKAMCGAINNAEEPTEENTRGHWYIKGICIEDILDYSRDIMRVCRGVIYRRVAELIDEDPTKARRRIMCNEADIVYAIMRGLDILFDEGLAQIFDTIINNSECMIVSQYPCFSIDENIYGPLCLFINYDKDHKYELASSSPKKCTNGILMYCIKRMIRSGSTSHCRNLVVDICNHTTNKNFIDGILSHTESLDKSFSQSDREYLKSVVTAYLEDND